MRQQRAEVSKADISIRIPAENSIQGLRDLTHSVAGSPCLQKVPTNRSVSSYFAVTHSHSIVAGGLLLISYTTRLTPRTLLMIRVETRASKSSGKRDQSAVMKSSVS